MSLIIRNAAKYKRVSTILAEGEAHLRDPFTPPPMLVKPPAPRIERKPDDITDFPHQKVVPLPEIVPYREGQYRPASIPLIAGYFPYNMYLQRGKVYQWCSCGISTNGPWCDSLCNYLVTRNRPVYFNVSESGYYKICNCKFSANAPFCSNTHRLVVKYHFHQIHRESNDQLYIKVFFNDEPQLIKWCAAYKCSLSQFHKIIKHFILDNVQETCNTNL